MSTLEKDLLEAVPATARRILLIGQELLRHREIWEQRNPLAAIDAVAGPWDASGESRRRNPRHRRAGRRRDACPRAGRNLAGSRGHPGPVHGKTGQRDGNPATASVGRRAGPDNGAPHRKSNGPCDLAPRPFTQLRVSGHELDARSGPLGPSVTRVRLVEPFEQLGSLPAVRCRTWVGDGPPAVVDPDTANILVVQRTFFVKPELYLRPAYQQNYITVAEFDDLPMVGGKFASEHCRSTLSGFHAIQVSTQALASFLRQFNPEVGVFGNHLARIRPLQARGAGRPLRLLFAALGRKGGWREIVQVYCETLAGYGDAAMTTVVGDREFFDHL